MHRRVSAITVGHLQGVFFSMCSLCFNLRQKFHLWLKLSLWWLNVTIIKISIQAKIQLKYSLKLFCCWYNCCVQTSTFQYIFKWRKFWNQISCVLCSRYEWTQNAWYLITELTSFEKERNVEVWTKQLYQEQYNFTLYFNYNKLMLNFHIHLMPVWHAQLCFSWHWIFCRLDTSILLSNTK